jgi:hypothetical protein
MTYPLDLILDLDLMTEIKESATRGVIALPPKRNLVPRFRKRGAQEIINDALIK